MTDKQIIYNCPHISLTDWGTYACKLYNPRDKNCLVKGGNCDSNISCPYKQPDQLKAENDELRMKNRILETECNEMRDVCNEFEQYYEHLMERHNKLKQTLTEIKEIVEQASEDYRMPEEEWNKILQKISECEGNDEKH